MIRNLTETMNCQAPLEPILSPRQRHPCVDSPLPDHAEMMQACKNGDVSVLRERLSKCTSTGYWNCSFEPQSGSTPCRLGMLIAAIENEQIEIVKFWLVSFRSFEDLRDWDVFSAVTRNFNREIAEVIHQHDEGWKSTDLDHWETFLSAVCYEGPKALPLVRFLLDKGANVRYGAFWDGKAGAVSPALRTNFPIEIIEEMIDRGAWLGSNGFKRELEKGNIQTLKLFIDRGRVDPTLFSWVKYDEVLQIAHNTQKDELISVIEDYVRRQKQEQREKEQKDREEQRIERLKKEQY